MATQQDWEQYNTGMTRVMPMMIDEAPLEGAPGYSTDPAGSGRVATMKNGTVRINKGYISISDQDREAIRLGKLPEA